MASGLGCILLAKQLYSRARSARLGDNFHAGKETLRRSFVKGLLAKHVHRL